MEPANMREYKILREEIKIIRGCIQALIGYVFAGAAAATVILVNGAISARWYLLGYASLAISLVSTMVLLIFFYKFHLLHRYMGYCKLLTHERFSKAGSMVDLVFWEICMDLLAASDQDHSLMDLSRTLPDLDVVEIGGSTCRPARYEREYIAKQIEPISGPHPRVDTRAAWKGLRLLLRLAFVAPRDHDTWRYPAYITSLFALLSGLFFVAGVLFLGYNYRAWWTWQYCVPVAVLVIHARLWFRFLRKLHCLMEGSATVDAYCWKFLPLRYHLVKNELLKDEGAKYSLVGVGRLKTTSLQARSEEPPTTTTSKSAPTMRPDLSEVRTGLGCGIRLTM